MPINEKQKHDLKKALKEIAQYKGRHTEMVSVYVPQGYDIVKIIQHLQQEQGTATNIKSASTRKNVIGALEKMIQHLKLYKATPPNGLAIFAGNTAPEGQQDFKVWSIEPPLALNTRIYKCDKEFALDLLQGMLDAKETFGLIVIDRRESVIAELRGKSIKIISKHTSNVPGKFKAGGQCLAKDSLVQVHDGRLPPIKSLHNPYIVKSVDRNNEFKLIDSNITDKWEVKKKSVYTIITKNPRLKVESSKDHVFFVSTSKGIVEKTAEELKLGEYLLMPEKINISGKTQKFNSKKYYNSFSIKKKGQQILRKARQKKGLYQKQLAKKIGMDQTQISWYEIGRQNADRDYLKKVCDGLDINYDEFIEKYTLPSSGKRQGRIKLPGQVDTAFAQFLGYYTGDGSIETDRITLFEQSLDVASSYIKKYEAYFNNKPSYRFRKQKNYHQIRFTSRPLVRLIKNEFPELKKALDSTIPEKILESKNEIVASFLRGFFDAEGYVNEARGVGLGINNKTLAHQIQLALLRFSIISSIHEYDNRRNKYSNNMCYTIDITEKQSLESFKSVIGLTSKIKYAKLNKLIAKKSDRSYARQIIVPGTKIRKLIEEAGNNLQLFPKVNNFFRNERMIGKKAFKSSIISKIKDKKLRKKLQVIAEYPILPVKIKKIEKGLAKVEMTDISVADQNFIANGLIVHNSAQRFARLRESAAKEFYDRIGDHVKEAFFGKKYLKGIIVGGPGPTKHEFIEGSFMPTELKNKIIATKDLTYTDEFGVQELLDRSQDVLASEELSGEKEIVQKFFDLLVKKPGIVTYGEKEVLKALQNGAVETLLVSESLTDEKIEMFEEEAGKMGTDVKIISTDTREGNQLKEFGGVAALLRYEFFTDA
jgi:peptide subunit release factor 1 (eRF1)/transcriptional regulator with XRE-family HTH domain